MSKKPEESKGQDEQTPVFEEPASPGEPTSTQPLTPQRRMTPIYDDYQTAVSMIRSGTPKLPTPTTPSASDLTAARPFGDNVEVPKTPDRRFSYSMTDVQRELVESYGDLRTMPATPSNELSQHVTTPLPTDVERRISMPIFPLQGGDPNDENEILIARGQYPAEANEDNPAGTDLGDDEIPLRTVMLPVSEVRRRNRGDPVTSQEIRASSAAFDFADDSKVDEDEPTSARVSGSTPTEASTVGNIVDQYHSGTGEDVDESQALNTPVAASRGSLTGFDMRGKQAQPWSAPQSRPRTPVSAGPPPTWPLPPPPPFVPRRSSQRRNSSGMLSTPGTYGNTSGLLNTKLWEPGTTRISPSGVIVPVSSQVSSEAAQSRLSSGPTSGRSTGFGLSGFNDAQVFDATRLSHVSEESTAQFSSDSGWLDEYVGEQYRNKGGSRFESGAGDLATAPTVRNFDPSAAWSPGHRRTDNVLQAPLASAGNVRRRGAIDWTAESHFGSLDQTVARDLETGDDMIDPVDDADWETLYESHSQSKINVDDVLEEDEAKMGSGKMPSLSSSTLNKAPVSVWDPLSKKAVQTHALEQETEELLKFTQEWQQNNKAGEAAESRANKSNMPDFAANAREAFLPEPTTPSRATTSKPAAQPGYRHPTPLQPEHKHPFTGRQPSLPPVIKTQSTSSTSTMANQMNAVRNRNINTTSGDETSTCSREEENARLREEYNRRIKAEIELYDPGKLSLLKSLLLSNSC